MDPNLLIPLGEGLPTEPSSGLETSRPIPLAVFANKTRPIVILNRSLQSQPMIKHIQITKT